MKIFNTILYKVQSPKNVGMIIRSHVAFQGDKVVFVGYEKPWDFKKGTQSFSRKLEKDCEFLHFAKEKDFFAWAAQEGIHNLAIEIDKDAIELYQHEFHAVSNLIIGNEKDGIPSGFLQQCDAIIKIPQFGQVACLNASVSASIAMYELRRNDQLISLQVDGSKYDINSRG